MRSLFSYAMILALACGCSSAGLREPPPLSYLGDGAGYAERKTYYDRMAVTQADGEGYVVGGQLYSDRAMKQHFRDFQSRNAYALARSAQGSATARAIGWIVPPPAGLAVGAVVGVLVLIASAFDSSPSNNAEAAVPIGAGAGLAIGTLGVSLPLSFAMGKRIEERRRQAAEAFNADLARRLHLQAPQE